MTVGDSYPHQRHTLPLAQPGLRLPILVPLIVADCGDYREAKKSLCSQALRHPVPRFLLSIDCSQCEANCQGNSPYLLALAWLVFM